MNFILSPLRRYFGAYRGLPGPMYTLFAASVVNAVGIFVFPFLTLYLTARLGMTTAQAGTVLLMTSLAYVPGNFIGGKIADKLGRKKVMIVSQILSALMYIPCGFPSLGRAVPWLVVASVFFDGISDPARSAMMTDLTTPENRRSAFSLTYLGHNLGFAVGSLIAGFLFEAAPSWIFWGNAIAVGIATSLVAIKVPETKPSAEQIEESYSADSTEKGHRGNLFSALASRPYLLAFSLLTSAYGFAYAQHRFALPLQLKATFGLPGPAIFGSLMTLNGCLVILLSTPIMALTKKWKPVNAVALAGLLFGAGFGMVAFSHSVLFVYVSTLIWTLGEIFNATNEGSYMANHTPISHRGRFQAVLPFIQGMGFTLSPPVAGKLISWRGLDWVWGLVGVVSVFAAAGLWILGKVEEGAQRRKAASGTIRAATGDAAGGAIRVSAADAAGDVVRAAAGNATGAALPGETYGTALDGNPLKVYSENSECE